MNPVEQVGINIAVLAIWAIVVELLVSSAGGSRWARGDGDGKPSRI